MNLSNDLNHETKMKIQSINLHTYTYTYKEKLKLYITKRDRGELLVQQTRKVFSNVLREVQLAKPNDFVTFGSCVQLKAPDMPGFPPRSKSNNYGVVLSGTLNERDIDKTHHFFDGCCLVCTPVLTPCVRNTFLIKSPDNCENREGHNLQFGQEFLLQVIITAQFNSPSDIYSNRQIDKLDFVNCLLTKLVESDGEPLYVRSEPPRVDAAHGPMQHNLVGLSNKPDRYAKWKVLYWDPKMRFETTGAPIPPSTRVVISHVMTGQCLAVEYSEWYMTLFGTDCGVSVHTYADIHGLETAECLWMFVTEKISSENAECTDTVAVV